MTALLRHGLSNIMRRRIGDAAPAVRPSRGAGGLGVAALACARLAVAALLGCGGPVAAATPPAAARSARPAAKPRPNLIVVVADGLRRDRVHPKYMRFLHTIGSNGVVFDRAYAPAPSRTPSVASLLTSRLPSQHGALHDAAALGASERTVAQALRRAGYLTATVLGHGVGKTDGATRGFERVVSARAPQGEVASAATVTASALEWLDRVAYRPVFLVVQYGEPAVPFTPSGAAQQRIMDERRRGLLEPALAGWRMAFSRALPPDAATRQGIEDAYDAEVGTLDDALQALIAGLETRGLLRNALVVVTSSHGTELGEHGGFGDGGSLYDESIRVPLVIARSPALPRRTVTETVSLLDVAPTLLEAAGVAAPATFQGRSLKPLLEGAAGVPARVAVSELACEGEGSAQRRGHRQAAISGTTKLVVGDDGTRTTYDLAADPREAGPATDAGPAEPPLRAALERARGAKKSAPPRPCPTPSGPPSILLVVFDTTRSDALSSYGAVAGTTPYTDTLADAGLRYAHAYSNSNWTLPSHLTLFTGLRPSGHGVRCGAEALPRSLKTLAERLRARGYETFGASENPWITAANGSTRGFEHFTDLVGSMGHLQTTVGGWLAEKRRGRPAFFFLNLMDAHDYVVREGDPSLPRDLDAEQIRARIAGVTDQLCLRRTGDPDLELLRRVYLGGVRVNDLKLSQVLQQLARARVTDRLVTVVTADHGEFFGERGLNLHDTGLGAGVLHVPLVVHGLEGVAPAVVPEAVQSADVFASILAWAGAPLPERIAGQPLPTAAGTEPVARTVVAEYTDSSVCSDLPFFQATIAKRRQPCGPADRIDGGARAVIRPPDELIVFDRHPAALFDLRSPTEEHDRAASEPETAATLRAALGDTDAAAPAPPPRAVLDPETQERLRALGYIVPPH